MSNDKKRTFVALVLDQSGSMSPLREEAVAHFNEQIQAMKDKASKDPSLEILASLVFFNHEVEVKMDNLNLDYVQELSEDSYLPSGTTALYDGIETAIQLIQPRLRPEDAALVVVVTDGAENASTPHNRESVPGKIKELQENGQWTFTYMCTSRDLATIQKTLYAKSGNIFATRYGSKATFKGDSVTANKTLTSNYFSARSRGVQSVNKAYVDQSAQGSAHGIQEGDTQKIVPADEIFRSKPTVVDPNLSDPDS
jgi:uncharacterized protein YegL